jgi:hypothetical protein
MAKLQGAALTGDNGRITNTDYRGIARASQEMCIGVRNPIQMG